MTTDRDEPPRTDPPAVPKPTPVLSPIEPWSDDPAERRRQWDRMWAEIDALNPEAFDRDQPSIDDDEVVTPGVGALVASET